MRIVITGASGNVGSGLLRALSRAAQEHEIIGVCRRLPSASPPFDGVSWRSIDLARPQAGAELAQVCEGADALVHLAWALQPVRERARLRQTNVGGTAAVLQAATTARVPHVVHASSIAAYAPVEAGRLVGEDHRTTGVPRSAYARDKSEAEALVRGFAATHPQTVVTVVRPTLVTQRDASGGFRSLFLDPLVPTLLLRWVAERGLPVLPVPAELAVQFVHADDVGRAIVAILDTRASGAFNLAADVLDRTALARIARARALPLPAGVFRAAVSALWRLRLLNLSPGWFDVATGAPLIDTTRAARELGWTPTVDSTTAAVEQLRGLAEEAEGASPALRRHQKR